MTGPGAARSVWELSPDPDMVGHLPNNPISHNNAHNSSLTKSSVNRGRNGPDENIYAEEATPGQGPTDETKKIFELLRAGYFSSMSFNVYNITAGVQLPDI